MTVRDLSDQALAVLGRLEQQRDRIAAAADTELRRLDQAGARTVVRVKPPTAAQMRCGAGELDQALVELAEAGAIRPAPVGRTYYVEVIG